MKEDEEGFRYPVVDTEKCIDCQKVKNHQYADIIELDGKNETIKKVNIVLKLKVKKYFRIIVL